MRKSWSEQRHNRGEGALKGWVTRKANEASRARRFDEVLAENCELRRALRAMLKGDPAPATDLLGFDK